MIPWYVAVHGIDIPANLQDGLLAFPDVTTPAHFLVLEKKLLGRFFKNIYPELLSGHGESRDMHKDVAEHVAAFVCKLYDLNMPSHSINDVHASLFCSYKSNVDNLPPIEVALIYATH